MELFTIEAFRSIDWKILLIFSSIYLVLFTIAEIAFHAFKVKVEYTRKFVHVFTGIIALFFPIYIKTPLDLILLCGSFGLILIGTLKFNLLQSVNSVERKTRGSILYPVVVVLCYLFQYYRETYVYFFIPILILALADPVAALVGQKYPYKKYNLRGITKTISGSSGFFIVAYIVSTVSLILKTDGTLFFAITASFLIAFITTITEAISIKGYDNLLIPTSAIGTLLILGL
jgi:dolichol kinase